MLLPTLLALVLAFQGSPVLPQESRPNFQHLISDNAALASVEILYTFDGQLVALRGDGRVWTQSTRQGLSLLPTCKGKVASADIRHLLETMLATDFLSLPRNTYLIIGDAMDWQKLQLHSIIVKAGQASAKRDFSEGEYGGKHQEIPEKFATIEKAIIELKSTAIAPETRCTLAAPLGSKND